MKTLMKILQSYSLMIGLLILLSILLAAATFIENSYGTQLAAKWIYKNPITLLIELLLIVNFAMLSVKRNLVKAKKWGVIILHWGFATIILGATLTHLFSQEGAVHIRQGQSSSTLLDFNTGRPIGTIPFKITLNKFTLKTYNGTSSPSSYESDLTINGEKYHAYMNNVVYYGAYRIYQSSYDKDLGGSILTVNKDLLGTIVTYIGYLALFLGLVLTMAHRHSRFRRLLKSLSAFAVLLALPMSAMAHHPVEKETPIEAYEKNVFRDLNEEKKLSIEFLNENPINAEIAEQFGNLVVQTPGGRMEPVDTYSRELLRKLARSSEILEQNPNQVLLGIISHPHIWTRIELIKVSNDELLAKINPNATSDKIAFIDAVDSLGDYRFIDQVNEAFNLPPNKRNKYHKEVIKLDEKINILYQLFNGGYLALFPNDQNKTGMWYSVSDDLKSFSTDDKFFVTTIMPWYIAELQKSTLSDNWEEPKRIIDMIDTYQQKKADSELFSANKIKAERLYNKLQLFKWAGFGYMGIGIVMLLVLTVAYATSRKLKGVIMPLIIIICTLFLAHSFGMGLRWYISGHAPWTNAYESMVYIGWATVVGGLLFVRKSQMTLALATFMGGAILFVSNLSHMDPQITPLVPVLNSYWLIFHVAVITASYGFFGICFLLGVTNLKMIAFDEKRFAPQIKELSTVSEMAMWLGLALMTIGTFLGAIWANESWGRYWGWDPKETWALITMLVYAAILHLKIAKPNLSHFWFAVLSISSLGSVLMTFFGVNYYLSGLHSYGSDSAPTGLYAIWVIFGIIGILAIVAYIRSNKKA